MGLKRVLLPALTIALAASCTSRSDPPPTGGPTRVSAAGGVATWTVGPSGGRLASGDDRIEVLVPRGQAAEGTRVDIAQSTPSGFPATHLTTLASFDVSPKSGKLAASLVTVRYDQTRVKPGTESGLLMFLQDHAGRWQMVDDAVDARAGTVTARWPHFSHAILAYVAPLFDALGTVAGKTVDIGRWLRDHVLTFELGPKKPADCDKKDQGWHRDAGWTFTSTNADGGRMLVPPLDGCAAAVDTDGKHHLEVTNRYWYAFSGKVPAGGSMAFDDLLAYSELPDTIIGSLEYLVSDRVLIPGHSRAHLDVKTNPAGQTVSIPASADIASLILSLVITAVDVSSLGTGKEVRAGVTALEDALWAERAAHGSSLSITDIADRMADPQYVAQQSAKYRPKEVPESLFVRFFDHMELYNCAYGQAKARFEALDSVAGDTSFRNAVGTLGTMTLAVLDECKKWLAVAYLGEAFKYSDPNQRERMAQKIVLALFDLKPEAAVNEASWAGWARLVGLDYTHGLLTGHQARDPRYDAFAGFDWAVWLRPLANCIEPTNEPWNVYFARLQGRQDVNGDGNSDYLVWGECPSSTSSWPLVLYVIDGASSPSRPLLLGRLGAADYFRDATASVSGKGKNTTVTLSGQALTPSTPFCCPDIALTLRYKWNGTTLAEIGRGQRRLN